ncbi:thioredoxin family protein [bacterium]|nr:thioredoxin family protein [bacterium]
MNTISLKEYPDALYWFSTPECTVCRVLRPAVASMIMQEFPKMDFVYIDTTRHPEIAVRYNVFTAPVAVAVFEGQETIRWARGFGIDEIRTRLSRLYALRFSD